MSPELAYITLNLLPGVGPIRVRQLIEVFGSPQAILAASAAELEAQPGIGAKLASTFSTWEKHASPERERAAIIAMGGRILTPASADYPVLLRAIKDPPLALYVIGAQAALDAAEERGLAVVGSRHTTLYGEEQARRLTTSAAAAGWVIISGLARGIDTLAHQAALDAGGATIAVIAGGLRHVTPPENRPLARAMVQAGGCVISEQPLDMRPDKRTFPMRNRIIAGLCNATLVIEAGFNSGSLITADKAFAFGRKVFAVPGRVDSLQSRGCHQLLKRGAKLTESLDDIADEFTLLPGFGAAAASTAAYSETPIKPGIGLDLSDLEQQLCKLMEAGDVSLDQLVQKSGKPVHTLLSTLMGLELKRVVAQLPGKRFVLQSK